AALPPVRGTAAFAASHRSPGLCPRHREGPRPGRGHGAAPAADPGAEPGAGPRRGASRRARALMRAGKARVLLSLALLVGAGWGYAFWGVRAARLERELAGARAAAVSGVEREWTVEGVGGGIFPELGVLVITHG